MSKSAAGHNTATDINENGLSTEEQAAINDEAGESEESIPQVDLKAKTIDDPEKDKGEIDKETLEDIAGDDDPDKGKSPEEIAEAEKVAAEVKVIDDAVAEAKAQAEKDGKTADEIAEIEAEAKAQAEKAQADKEAEEAAAKAKAEEEAEANDTGPSTFVPVYDIDPERLTTIKTEIDGIDTQREVLGEQLSSEEIDFSEYHKQLVVLNKSEMVLVAEQSTLQSQQHFNETTPEQQWKHDQKVFFETAEGKTIMDDSLMYGAIKQAVIDLTTGDTGQANSSKSNAWILNAAKEQVFKRFDKEVEQDETEGEKTARLKAEQAEIDKKRTDKDKPIIKKGPQTLADTPADEINQDEIDKEPEFIKEIEALIDAGDTMGAESKIAKLTPEQEKQFLDVGEGRTQLVGSSDEQED